MSSFVISKEKSGVYTVVFNLKDEKVNILKSKILLELDKILDELKNDKKLKILIFKSGKLNSFIAGADISEIKSINNKKDAIDKVKLGQDILTKFTELNAQTICYINGACMGGGTELALCFDYRLAAKSDKVKIALPEVNLGIIPGFGGTQRLPRLIGLIDSLPMILIGKPVNYRKAFKIGLIDGFFYDDVADEKISEFIAKIKSSNKSKKIVKRRKNKLLDKITFLDFVIFKKAYKNLMLKTGGKYPAPLTALSVIRSSYKGSLKSGLKKELVGFSKIVSTKICKNLIALYFTNEAIKKDNMFPDSIKSFKISQSATLGAGIMGGGIAWFLTKIDIPVRIKDISYEGISLGYQQVDDIYRQLKKIRKVTDRDIEYKTDLISHSLNYNGFKDVELVIEAIIEDIDIKKSAFIELEKNIHKNTIVASNTSSLSIAEMASAFKYPERFIGMHFFNPVNRMPLVEVITHNKTSKEVLKTIVDLTYKSGKTPIIVKDSPGFLVNRILLPYLNEAGFLLEEIGDIKKIDKVIKDFGMPMGPFTLADNVGIDVGYKVAKILEEGFGKRMKVSNLLTEIYKKGLLGKKAKLGFYNYKSKNLDINQDIIDICNKNYNFQESEIIDRLILIMINEAAFALEDKIVDKAEHVDIAMIMGTGFPAFRGGLLKYADNIGLDEVVSKLKQFEKQVSPRYKPANLLVKLAKENKKFYQD